ncbi:MAG: NAD(+)/NADH kinase, partial [bacterium]
QERMMLEAYKPDNESEVIHSLNDMVLSRSKLGRVIQVAAYIDEDFVTSYVCDGIIVSTPTGSTAYNLSANGPITHPDLESIILNPICPHTLTNRPLIIPPERTVRLVIETEEECILTADGQDRINSLLSEDEIVIKQSRRKVQLIQPEDRDFYQILRSKLHWGGKTSS